MPEDRLDQARDRLLAALRAGDDTTPHREAIKLLEQAQKAAVEPTEPVDTERQQRIAKRAKQIAKQAMRDVQSQIDPIPELPA